MSKKLSPMMTFYLSLKEDYKDAIVLFRLGDFYEMFFDDAVTASNILGLTLTGRDCGLEERAPMCGVPFHAVDGYIAKLINAGKKVAICEQLTEATPGKGMVERGVVRVITPGTVIEDNILDEHKNNYLASVYINNNNTGISWVDISTGEFNAMQLNSSNTNLIEDMLVTIMPSEIICDSKTCDTLNLIQSVKLRKLPRPYMYIDSAFSYNNAYKKLTTSFKVISMQVFECEGNKSIISSAGGLMEYLTDTQKRALSHINGIKVIKNNNFMFIDSSTRRNLELTQNNRDVKKFGSLLWVIDKTKTNMGARLLRKWIDQPLINSKKINARLDSVEELISNNSMRSLAIDELVKMRDLERLAGKIAYGSIGPRDMLSLCDSLIALPKLKEIITLATTDHIKKINSNIDTMSEIAKLLYNAIDSECSNLAREGGFIKSGFNADLDELTNAKENGENWKHEIEEREREATGIKTLKIGYNKVFGYYIEITNSFKDKVPFRYVRKQTLTNAERYITDELKQLEDVVLGASDKALKLELTIFDEIKKCLLEIVPSLKITANAIATLDALVSFSEVARELNFAKPIINNDIKTITITKGRHPVVEKIIGQNQYIPNDTIINDDDNRTMIITGPNMSGKSTYMRSVAIITLLAHIGCFVPAESAEISITDRIFTRIGASDDLAFGQSTFMVEMIEVATIIKNATDKSLLILDEIGRGTSTCDGLSIAWAVVEHINKTMHTKTMFSTHYHELNELEGLLDGVKNYRILVSELGNQIVFTHKIARGGANKSFGIEVAKLAGIPDVITIRANEICLKLEENDIIKDTNSIMLNSIDALSKDNTKQLSFFSNSISDEITDKLGDIDMDNITPMQAFMELSNLKEMLRRIKNGKN